MSLYIVRSNLMKNTESDWILCAVHAENETHAKIKTLQNIIEI